MSFTGWAELLAGGLITGGIYALVAIGLNLQYGLMRIMNISHGEFLMLGAFLTWWAHTAWGISPLVFLPVAFAALMVIGMAVHWLCFRQVAARAPSVEGGLGEWNTCGSSQFGYTRFTKLSTTFFSPAFSKAMVSLLPSIRATFP